MDKDGMCFFSSTLVYGPNPSGKDVSAPKQVSLTEAEQGANN